MKSAECGMRSAESDQSAADQVLRLGDLIVSTLNSCQLVARTPSRTERK